MDGEGESRVKTTLFSTGPPSYNANRTSSQAFSARTCSHRGNKIQSHALTLPKACSVAALKDTDLLELGG